MACFHCMQGCGSQESSAPDIGNYIYLMCNILTYLVNREIFYKYICSELNGEIIIQGIIEIVIVSF